jgi:lipopolysaccharide/colanic/teichoic acid biosynthesis glycosyltransferase
LTEQIRPRLHPYQGKRAFDLAVLAVVLVPAILVCAVCAVAILLAGPGPIFFTQERVGRDGRPFRVVKFRTMLQGSDRDVFPDRARITAVGRWLRRLSFDELPQLINVAKGEMSIVGPRPALQYQVERYNDVQRRRLSVRPGITGLAQVRGRNMISWPDRISLDLEYVDHESAALDTQILWLTVQAVTRGTGVEGHLRDDPIASLPPG